jgi:hypothetical protein
MKKKFGLTAAVILWGGTGCQPNLHVGSAISDGGSGGVGAFPGVPVCASATGGAAGAAPTSALSFVAPVRYAPAHGAISVDVGDLNGDGKADLVTHLDNYPDIGLEIRMSQSGGGWAAPISCYPPGADVLDDMDGDGKVDIVALELNPSYVAILWNDGAGGFTPAFIQRLQEPAPSGAISLATGDLDGDGRMDVAVMQPVTGSGAGEAVSVLLNQGGRRFTLVDVPGTIPSPAQFTSPAQTMAIGDFDGDGKGDLVITSGASDTPGFYLLHGEGGGAFSAPVLHPLETAPSAILVGDLDGDARPDLVTASESAGLSVLLNDGRGGFASPVAYPASGDALALGDLNGDGRPDLVAAGTTMPATVLFNAGGGSFVTGGRYSLRATSIALADLNGDGKIDLAVDNGLDLVFVLNDGTGRLIVAPSYAADSNPRGVVVGDLDGDGKPDLAAMNYTSGDVSVLLNRADGTFAPAVDYPVGTSPTGVVVADVDGDGKLDLVVASTGSSGADVLLNKGGGTFSPAVSYPASSQPVALATGDFNGDGRLDLAVVNQGDAYGGGVSVLLNAGRGTFGAATSYGVGVLPTSVATGDFDGDGTLDLVVANGNTGDLSMLFNDGQGRFAAAVNRKVGMFPQAVAICDLNGDGRPDLVTANVDGFDLSVLLNQGGGSFTVPVHIPLGVSPVWVVPADIDGDGSTDLAVVSATFGDVQILLNDGSGKLTPSADYAAGGQSVAASDLNGDGKIDLAVVNTAGASILINTTP